MYEGDDIAFKPDALTAMQLESPLFKFSEIKFIYEKNGSLNMLECDNRIKSMKENLSGSN